MKRFVAVFKARNIEFFRDRAALSWNLVLPVLLVVGFAFLFSDQTSDVFKVGVYPAGKLQDERVSLLGYEHVQFVEFDDLAKLVDKVKHHQLDMALDMGDSVRYWINSGSANGYFLEKLLAGGKAETLILRETVQGDEIRYVDWVLPGILAMNMMFGCFWGIGYVIVRYRKNRVLRRLKATPLSAFEFLAAQVVSRFLITLTLTIVVYFGCDLFVGFFMQGSLLDLFVVFALGIINLISMGLIVASRIRSEELSDGVLNLLTWPMMLMSGVWFSLEGAAPWVQNVSHIFPLTHMIGAARAIMNDGATLADVSGSLLVMALMTMVFMTIGSLMFRWE